MDGFVSPTMISRRTDEWDRKRRKGEEKGDGDKKQLQGRTAQSQDGVMNSFTFFFLKRCIFFVGCGFLGLWMIVYISSRLTGRDGI